jgi:hypothetical protein
VVLEQRDIAVIAADGCVDYLPLVYTVAKAGRVQCHLFNLLGAEQRRESRRQLSD